MSVLCREKERVHGHVMSIEHGDLVQQVPQKLKGSNSFHRFILMRLF